MRKGLLDVLPKNALEDLTAEDFRLLVNGCGEVNVQMLISFTSFNDESGTFQDLQTEFRMNGTFIPTKFHNNILIRQSLSILVFLCTIWAKINLTRS